MSKKTYIPKRGDAVETWIKDIRDRTPFMTSDWDTLDMLLDDYRMHADNGLPLHHVPNELM